MIYKYFKYPLIFTILGFVVAFWFGYMEHGLLANAFLALWECFILSLLEISLSFDNAVLNARIVKGMNVKWQKIFLYFGIFIAVFGMRILMPLLLVMIIVKQGFVATLMMALYTPSYYIKVLSEAQLSLNVFGASFLALVSLSFFLDKYKTEHWVKCFEKPLTRIASFPYMSALVNLCLAFISFYFYQGTEKLSFIISFLLANLVFYIIEFLSNRLSTKNSDNLRGWQSFLYLEILDSTFSFDGVLGAFALSHNFVIIVLGLSIGAFYVRSMTIMFVRENSLANVAFIEHGAFYAILSLAIIMYAKVNVEIPEYIAGLCSVSFIIASLLCSYHKVSKS